MIEEGFNVTYSGPTPTRPNTSHKEYTFSGWDKPLINIKAETVFTAKYDEDGVNHVVSFYKDAPKSASTLLSQIHVKDGELATYTGADPTKEATAEFSYAFSGWDRSLTLSIIEDTDFVAQYTPTTNEYTVSFYLDSTEGTPLHTESVKYGEHCTYDAIPDKPAEGTVAYSFLGWDKKPSETLITGDTKFYGTWSEYTNGLIFALSNDGTYYICKGANDASKTEIVIPDTYKLLPVKEIGLSAFNGFSYLKSVTFPKGLTKIANSAFMRTDLTSVTLPKSVDTLLAGAFMFCESLTNVDMSLCTELKVLPLNTFLGCTALTFANIKFSPNLTEIDEGAFAQCDALSTFEVPSSVTTIEGGAFTSSPLATISVASGSTAFKAVDNVLYSLDGKNLVYFPVEHATAGTYAIPEGVATIMEYAFANCKTLSTAITFPTTLTTIGAYAFNNTRFGVFFDLSKTALTTLGMNAFDGSIAITEMALPNTLSTVETNVFAKMTGLKSMYIPSGVTNFKADCLASDTCTVYLEASVAPQSLLDNKPDTVRVVLGAKVAPATGMKFIYVTGYGYYASYSGTATSVVVPNYYDDGTNGLHPVYGIANNGFGNQTTLTSVTLPESLQSIGDEAFSGCTGLTTINIPAAVQYFKHGNYLDAFNGCTSLTSYTVDPLNKYYSAVNGYLYDKAGTELLDIPQGLTTATIPAATTEISSYVAYGDTKLTSIDMSGCTSLTYINDAAFVDMGNLATLTLPGDDGALETISGSAFYILPKLTTITLPKTLTSVSSAAFYYSKGLDTINVSANNATYQSIDGVLYSKDGKTLMSVPPKHAAFTIPSSVTIIESGAYNYAAFTSIVVPEGVTKIYDSFELIQGLVSVVLPKSLTHLSPNCFYSDNALTDIFYAGDETDYTTNLASSYGTTPDTRWRYYTETANTDGNHWHYVSGVPTVYAA
jgi:hypothetical protein